MKKIIVSLCLLSGLYACEDSKMKELDAKVEESKCRAEFASWLYEHSLNTELLLIQNGYQDEVDAFHMLQKDTLISCDSLKKVWSDLSEKNWE